jgi:hypothetical protein
MGEHEAPGAVVKPEPGIFLRYAAAGSDARNARRSVRKMIVRLPNLRARSVPSAIA